MYNPFRYANMEQKLFEYIDEMLENVQEEVTDSDLRFKIRTARQTLIVLEDQHTTAQDALKKSDISDKTLESLRQLGYLD